MFYNMRSRIKTAILAIVASLMLFSCTYTVPYLSLDVRTEYNEADITINYSYVCEGSPQRCVYSLYNIALPSEIIDSGDGVMDETGTLNFNGLSDGDYRLFFSVYSEKNGEYSLLSYLDKSWDFTVNLP